LAERAADGPIWPRLLAIKRRSDPRIVFRENNALAPDGGKRLASETRTAVRRSPGTRLMQKLAERAP
jgi:hypothetical protein